MRCNPDEYGRQQMPFAHAWRFTKGADAGFHSFDTEKHLGTRHFHSSQREDLAAVKNKRLSKAERKHRLFALRYERAVENEEFLREGTQRYKEVMRCRSESDLKKSKSLSDLAGMFARCVAEGNLEGNDNISGGKNLLQHSDSKAESLSPKSKKNETLSTRATETGNNIETRETVVTIAA